MSGPRVATALLRRHIAELEAENAAPRKALEEIKRRMPGGETMFEVEELIRAALARIPEANP